MFCLGVVSGPYACRMRDEGGSVFVCWNKVCPCVDKYVLCCV